MKPWPVPYFRALMTAWSIAALAPKPKHAGGIVTLTGTCTNQDGIQVAAADAKIPVRNN